jgi:hypothetical protein
MQRSGGIDRRTFRWALAHWRLIDCELANRTQTPPNVMPEAGVDIRVRALPQSWPETAELRDLAQTDHHRLLRIKFTVVSGRRLYRRTNFMAGPDILIVVLRAWNVMALILPNFGAFVSGPPRRLRIVILFRL